MCHFIPVTSGTDQDEEEDVNCESINDGYDGAFRDGNTWSLQLPFRDNVEQEQTSGCAASLWLHELQTFTEL